MIISFAGNAGSGKSTVAEKLAEKLGWPRYYMGGIRREYAKKLGMTLEEYNKLGETDPSTDSAVDEYQTELAQKEDNFIIEGRTSWHFIPQSFKIFVDVDEKVGAERILSSLLRHDNRNETSHKIGSLEEMIQKNRERKASDNQRYRKYYGIDAYDPKNFDFIIDTSNLTPEEVFERVYAAVLAKLG
jgi:cytidylate kinase